jgi:flagellar basal-body rod modification protein FlgD
MITGYGITGMGARAVQNSADVATTSSSKSTGQQDLGEDAFLKLLVAELEHQDPLNPMDNNQFISQLATFHSLEKLTSIDDILKKAYPETASQTSTISEAGKN